MRKNLASICVDYLSVSLKVPMSYSRFGALWIKNKYPSDVTGRIHVRSDFTLIPVPIVNGAYKGCFTVVLSGEVVGRLYTDGIQKGVLSFKFENSLFYNYSFNPEFVLNSICDAFDTKEGFKLYFAGITRLDIACDSNYDSLSFYAQKVHQTLSNSFFSSKASKTIKAKFKNLSNAKVSQVGNSLYFGSIKSGSKSVCIYPKSDLQPYQSSYIESGGVDVSLPVYRIECRLINGSTKVSQLVHTLDMLCDPEFLVSLFLRQSRRILTLVNLRTDKDFNALRFLNLVSPVRVSKILARTVPRRSNENKRYLKHNMVEYLNNVHNNLHEINNLIHTRTLSNDAFDLAVNRQISLDVLFSIQNACLNTSAWNSLYSMICNYVDAELEQPIDPLYNANLTPLPSYSHDPFLKKLQPTLKKVRDSKISNRFADWDSVINW